MDAMAAIWWTTAISCSYKESSFDQVSKCKGSELIVLSTDFSR